MKRLDQTVIDRIRELDSCDYDLREIIQIVNQEHKEGGILDGRQVKQVLRRLQRSAQRATL